MRDPKCPVCKAQGDDYRTQPRGEFQCPDDECPVVRYRDPAEHRITAEEPHPHAGSGSSE